MEPVWKPESTKGLQRSPGAGNTEPLAKFAQNMARDIIESSRRQIWFRSDLDDRGLVEDLVSGVMWMDLTERTENIQGRRTSRSPDNSVGYEEDLMDSDVQFDSATQIQTSTDPHGSPPALSQSWLPDGEFLDYPDAPPSTPLGPEPEMGSQIFAQKLKGGLANVFLPSPPPPTPMDQDGNLCDEVDFVEHLMQSLSTDKDPNPTEARLRRFADDLVDALLAEVMDDMKIEESASEDDEIDRLTQQMAETIIDSCLHPGKTCSTELEGD